MDVDSDPPNGRISVARDKTAPFLIRTFVKIGGFHRLTLFEDGTLPTTDEHQLFTWKDATLKELLTTLRTTSPHTAEFKHPLARFSFKTVYADSTNKGRFAQKDLGMVYSRDILGEPGSNGVTAPRFLEDDTPAKGGGRGRGVGEGEGEGKGEGPAGEAAEGGVAAQTKPLAQREREERTLDDLRLVPGDYLLVSVILPKSATGPTELMIKGSGTGGNAAGGAGPGAGWRSGAAAVTNAGPPPGRGGGGHWRGDSNAPAPGSRGRGGRAGGGGGGRDRDRDRNRDDRDRDDRRVPPPRRHDSTSPRVASGWRGRGGRGGGGGRSRSRSRSPPPRRRAGRHD